MVVTLETSQALIAWSNDGFAPLNNSIMDVTLETFHTEMSWLNAAAFRNREFMLFTLEVFHEDMS